MITDKRMTKGDPFLSWGKVYGQVLSAARPRTAVAVVLLCAFAGAAVGQTPALTWQTPKPPDNAAFVYYRAFLTLSPLGDKGNTSEDKAFQALCDQGAYEAKELDPYVDRNSDVLTQLLEAAAIDACDFGVLFDQGPAAPLPELARARELARLGIAAMRKATNQSEWDRAVALFTAVLKLARGVHQEGTVIGALVAVAMVDILGGQAGYLLAACPPAEPRYMRMDSILDQVIPTVSDWSNAIEGEKKLQAYLFPPPGVLLTPAGLERLRGLAYVLEGGYKSESPIVDLFTRIEQGIVSPKDREKLAPLLGCSVDDLSSLEGLSTAFSRNGANVLQMLIELQSALAKPYSTALLEVGDIGKRAETQGQITSRMVGGLGNLPRAKTKIEARLAMMRVAVAIKQWQAAHGTLPASLADLQTAVPTDPFTDGQPFAYLPLDKGGFSLTSKGMQNSEGGPPLAFKVTLPK